MNHLLIFENFIKETYAPNKDFPQEVPRDMPYTTDMQRTPEDYGVFVDKLIYSDIDTSEMIRKHNKWLKKHFHILGDNYQDIIQHDSVITNPSSPFFYHFKKFYNYIDQLSSK